MDEPTDLSSSILVVDDNAQNLALVEDALTTEGYRVLLASSADEALALFARETVDCALLDVKMPGMDGIELCRMLRRDPKGAKVPIVFLTAMRDLDTFDAALEAGGDDFLIKPIRPFELTTRVRTALEVRRLAAENRGFLELVRNQRDALMRLQLQKEKLTAYLVHDLKNPVSAADLHAQLLLRDRSLSERAQHSARAIREEARTLMRLISDMLDLSKDDSGQLSARVTSFSIEELLVQLREEFAARAKVKDVTLEVSYASDQINGDPGLLARALQNLLDNALRHAPSGSRIRVQQLERDGSYEVQVSDQGRGVPEPLRERIFERFAQEGGARDRSGYGLGLAFCKLVAELHQGSIHVADAAPGAVFCLRWPMPSSADESA